MTLSLPLVCPCLILSAVSVSNSYSVPLVCVQPGDTYDANIAEGCWSAVGDAPCFRYESARKRGLYA